MPDPAFAIGLRSGRWCNDMQLVHREHRERPSLGRDGCEETRATAFLANG